MPVKILVGNKSDLNSVVDIEEGKAKAVKYNMDYIETSAKEAYQVEALFQILASRLIEKGTEIESYGEYINKPKAKKKKRWCIC